MAEAREARVYVLAGPDLARSFPLRERSTLGRSDECDVVLRDRSISRKHAVVVREGERWFVQDLGSTNGLKKGGKRGERFELSDGDEFELGELPLRFRLEAPAGAGDIEFDLAPPAKAEPPPAARPEPPRPPPAASDEDEIEIELPGAEASAAAARAPLPATTFRPARSERRTGFFAGDLEQQPFWLRCVIVLVLVALCAGLGYGAFLAVEMLRGS